jgi:hypothetical protein
MNLRFFDRQPLSWVQAFRRRWSKAAVGRPERVYWLESVVLLLLFGILFGLLLLILP